MKSLLIREKIATYDDIQYSIVELIKKDLTLKRYSQSTIDSYTSCIAQWEKYFMQIPLQDLHRSQIIDFLIYLNQKGYSSSSVNQFINSLKYFYEKILLRPKEDYYFPRPRKEFRLPDTISKEEIERIIGAIKNLKHKTIISFIYAHGLRISEVITLKISDINSQNMTVKIRNSKGNKDRWIPLSEHILPSLRMYFIEYRPREYLFNGQNKPQYSAESIRKLLFRACKVAKVGRKVTPHTLRHSYATHLLEQGVDIKYIKEILGHNNIKTTEIYTHCSNKQISKIRSPFDSFNI